MVPSQPAPLRPGDRRRPWTGTALVALGAVALLLGLNIYLSAPDSVYYWSVPRSLVLHGDLSFEDDVVDFPFPLNQIYITRTGFIANDWPIGAGLVWTPLFALGRAISSLLPADPAAIAGGGPAEKVTVALGIIALALGGLALAWRLARGIGGDAAAAWAVAGLTLGGPLIFYLLLFTLMAHATSFAAVTLFLWGWQVTRGERTPAQWVLLGLLFGWLLAIRPQSAACGLVWVAEACSGAGRPRRRAWFGGLAAALAAAALAFSPQMLLWWGLYGDALQFPKLEEMHWLRPRLWDLLFSDFHGLLVWTPVWALPFLGLPLLVRRDRVLGSAVAAVLLAQVYLNAANEIWWAGGSFSNRRFTDYTAFAALAAAPLFATPRVGVAARVWAVLGTAWSLGLIWAERAGLLTLDHYVTLREMAHGVREVATHPLAHAPALVGDFGGLGALGRVVALFLAAGLVGGLWLAARHLPARWKSPGRLAVAALAAQVLVIAGLGAALLRTPLPALPRDLPQLPRHNATLWNNHYEYGFYHLRRGDPDAAEDAFRRAIELWPLYPQPFRYLARIAASRGDLPRAIAILKDLLRRDPYDEATRALLDSLTR